MVSQQITADRTASQQRSRTPISEKSGMVNGTRIDSGWEINPNATAVPGHRHLAREIYEHILSTQPDHLESLKELGQMDFEEGKFAQAIERLSQVVGTPMADAECFHRLGQAYAAQGDSSNAETAQRRALELDPQMAAAHFDLGVSLRQQNKLGEATASFQQTLRLDQNHGGAFHQLGGTLEQQGNIDQALVCYQEARLKELIDAAFEIGMLQIRSEIEALVRTVLLTAPRHILEIGSHRGGTMYLWCKLLENSGHRITVDLPGGDFGGLAVEEIESRNVMMSGWSENFSAINADSHAVSTYEKVRETLDGEKLDFLFIDGDHTYEGVKLDFFMYKNLVREGGLIAFHDIKDTQLHRDQNCHVARLWGELSGDKMQIQSDAQWGGIGVIQC